MHTRTGIVVVSTLVLLAFGCGHAEHAEHADHEDRATEEVAADPGTSYGAELALADGISISALLADPAAYEGQAVRVEGMITDVCPKRGCWFEMAGEGAGQKVRFKVEDGVMVFPMEAKGKYAVAEGTVVVNDMTLEETIGYFEHMAEERGEAFDPASVTEPMTMVRLDGTGAVIRESK